MKRDPLTPVIELWRAVPDQLDPGYRAAKDALEVALSRLGPSDRARFDEGVRLGLVGRRSA